MENQNAYKEIEKLEKELKKYKIPFKWMKDGDGVRLYYNESVYVEQKDELKYEEDSLELNGFRCDVIPYLLASEAIGYIRAVYEEAQIAERKILVIDREHWIRIAKIVRKDGSQYYAIIGPLYSVVVDTISNDLDELKEKLLRDCICKKRYKTLMAKLENSCMARE